MKRRGNTTSTFRCCVEQTCGRFVWLLEEGGRGEEGRGAEVLLDVRNLSPRIAGGIRKKTKATATVADGWGHGPGLPLTQTRWAGKKKGGGVGGVRLEVRVPTSLQPTVNTQRVQQG